MKNQIHLYSLDTGCFYTPQEQQYHNQMLRFLRRKKLLKETDAGRFPDNKKEKYKKLLALCNAKIREYKERLSQSISADPSICRTLNGDKLTDTRIISVFESALTRAASIPSDTLTCDLMVVQTYFYDIVKQLVINGYTYKNEAYIYFTSSAGQIRTKKTVFIRETLWEEIKDTLMCGLTIEKINQRGGMNVNKFLAYLALSNSATDPFEGFDIRRCIVVPDFETSINCEVDFIHDDTYEIERTSMDIPIPHTDGCGMILPRLSKKNFMLRLPWVKGLLASFDFVKFIREKEASPVVTDIYGREWDILKDNIQIILTKSQFKMHRYYDSWEAYQDAYEAFGCQAGICNMEEDYFSNASINYQMLQTLIDVTDEEAGLFIRRSLDTLERISSDRDTILRIFGVVKSNEDKTWLQQALEIYPEMLQDEYCRARLREIKKSLVRQFRAGKLEIQGKYTFLAPDLYAFCERLFLGIETPVGLLKNGEVSCRLFRDGESLDCLRSPHLYMEHAIRSNTVTPEISRWFCTNAIYTSTHDPISRILQFDVDGDRALVVSDPAFVNAARRNMEENQVVPLYYEMKKAHPVTLTGETIYEGLNAAYTGGNIGYYSNSIAKIFHFTDWKHISPEEKKHALRIIKLLCMENNFCIDMAKTLYMPERPEQIHTLISAYTQKKLPHFFQYAKGKTESQTESPTQSFVDQLDQMVKYRPIRLSAKNFGTFSYRKLMRNTKIQIDETVIETYNRLNRRYHFRLTPSNKDNIDYVIKTIREELLTCGYPAYEVADMLVRHLYTKKTPYKEILWQCFGDILTDNLRHNIPSGSILCKNCGARFLPASPNQKYCDACRGYQPVGTKIITCVDCGCQVEISSRDTSTCRCPLHQKEHKKRLRREQNRRAYERRKAIQ